MRRILVLFSVPLMVALGIGTAGSASADTINGGKLADGTAVIGKITAPNKDIQYSFSGTNGIHETLAVTASDWGSGSAQLGVYLPNGEAALFCPIDASATFCEFTPHVTGTWTVKLLPVGDSTGSVSFKVAADQAGALIPGKALTTKIAIQGQRAGYTFTGAKGVHGTIDVSATDWGTGSADLNIYQPDGVLGVICPIDTSPTTCEFTPPVSGTWKAEIAPDDDSLGSATMTLSANPDRGTLTPGKPSVTAISSRATTASYTFAATQGVRNVIAVSAANWGTGTADLNIYQPDGVNAVICPIDSTSVVCDFTPPVTGTWKAEIAPEDNAVGSATLTLAADQLNGLLTAGVATTTTIATSGQTAYYTFPATKGEKRVINVSATNWGKSGSAELNIYQPDGVLGVICPMASTRTTCAFSPPMSGTWQVQIAPDDNAVGSATMTLVADQGKGSLKTGVAFTAAIPIKGTTASYTFTGTKGVNGVFDVSATDWGTGSADLKIYLPNGDLGLTCSLTTAQLCPFVPRVTGTWKAVIDPVDDSTGTVTMTLGFDQNKGALTAGTPVTTTFASRGWQTSYTFKATARLHTSIDVTATNWGTGSGGLYVYQPNGVLAVICPLGSTPTFCDFIPPVAGTWKVAVVPAGNSIGSATMNLAPDQDNGSLSLGTAVTTTIKAKGQRASYTFTGTSGKKRTITVTATDWGSGGSATIDLYLPNGQVGVKCSIKSTPTACTFTPHATGTWKAVVVPVGNSVGGATFTLS